MDQTNEQTRKNAFIALLIASIIWGVSSPIMKLALEVMPLALFAYLRFAFATILLLIFFHPKLSINKKDILSLIFASLCGVTFNIYFFFYGLQLTTALNAGVIMGSVPIFTLLFSAHFLKEKVTKNLYIAAAIGFLGLLVIIIQPIFSEGISSDLMGNILLFISALFWILYEIFSKKLFKTYSASTVTFYSFLIGSLTFLPFILGDLPDLPFYLANSNVQIGLLYGIFLTSLAAYFLWQWGLSKIPASKVGFFFYLDPIVGTAASIIILGEALTVPFMVGSVLIFLGLFLAERKVPYHHHAKAIKSKS